jgi:hypothetical protein
MPRWCVRLNGGSGLLAGEVTSSRHRSRLGGGMQSMGLRHLLFIASVMPLGGVVGFRLWLRRL